MLRELVKNSCQRLHCQTFNNTCAMQALALPNPNHLPNFSIRTGILLALLTPIGPWLFQSLPTPTKDTQSFNLQTSHSKPIQPHTYGRAMPDTKVGLTNLKNIVLSSSLLSYILSIHQPTLTKMTTSPTTMLFLPTEVNPHWHLPSPHALLPSHLNPPLTSSAILRPTHFFSFSVFPPASSLPLPPSLIAGNSPYWAILSTRPAAWCVHASVLHPCTRARQ